MPPRFTYWTILIDNAPTAFRARDALELLPTLNQLRRTNTNVTLKWFSHGRLWDSPEAARDARRKPKVAGEKRGPGWRPGGAHRDPREKFRGQRQRRNDRVARGKRSNGAVVPDDHRATDKPPHERRDHPPANRSRWRHRPRQKS